MAAVSSLALAPYNTPVELPMLVDSEQQHGLQPVSGKLKEPGSLARLDKMARFIAHDFRHHLSAIYANAELMCNTNYAQSDREEMLEEIRTAVKSMTDILDSFLIHTKWGGDFHLQLEPLKLLIEKAMQMVRSHPHADNVEFIYEDMPPVEVCAESTWLCSAIFNLLLNACQSVQFAPGAKEVRIACHQDRSHVSIRITDSGPGVSKKIQASLFESFGSLCQRMETGHGLSIVMSIVRQHGGEVYMEESKPGR